MTKYLGFLGLFNYKLHIQVIYLLILNFNSIFCIHLFQYEFLVEVEFDGFRSRTHAKNALSYSEKEKYIIGTPKIRINFGALSKCKFF